ncbi:Fur family transcriptional regulator [Thermoanaerobacterium sp. DL9XJH110]|uniref:Fur family transcriptional regulator n=1 Tax=Thermoanaerobacterium sp. DL9XJH110 TaxID=3386643 RepID=UPI003BB7C2BE
MDVEKLLKENELKVTPQRKAILQVLEKSKALLNAQELFQEVIKLVPGTNFSTIYRNLDLLLSRGILCRIASESGGVLYELRRRGNHHHHVICKGCGAAIPVDFCPMKAMEKELDARGFTPTEHRFEIYGYCNKCYRKRSN